jgi:hypothetical protein
MNTGFDYDLSLDQWETLKAFRRPAAERRGMNRFIVDELVALGLAIISDGSPRMTGKGRSVLMRGSPRLLDLVA